MAAHRTSLLRQRPLTTAGLYSVVGSFPLFFAGGFAVRLQEDLGISKSQFGLTIAAYFITSAVGSFVIGSLIDKFGTRSGFGLAGVGGGVSAVLVAISQSFWPLAIALGLAGISNTAGQLAGNRVLANVSTKRQGLGFGTKQAAVPLGSFIAGTVIGTLGAGIDWRASFLAYSVFAFATVLIIPNLDGAVAEQEPRRPVGADWPMLTALAIAGFLGGAAGNGLAVLTVDFFSVAGFAERVGAAALALGSGITIVTRTGIGWFAGRRESTGFIELGIAMTVGAVGFVLLSIGQGSVAILWAGAAIAFLGAWGWPGVMYYAVVKNATTTPGTATGFVVTGVFMGGIAGAPVLAAIAERASYDVAWLTAAIMGAVAAGLTLVASRLASVRRGQVRDEARVVTPL